MSSSLTLTRSLFLRGLALCLALAFFSVYTQIEGLYGPQGVLPVAKHVDDMVARENSIITRRNLQPGLLRYLPQMLHLDPDLVMDAMAILGGITAALVALDAMKANKFWILFWWLLYYSLFEGGQTFLWFQWDTLLLETTVIALVLAPFPFFDLKFNGECKKEEQGSKKKGKKDKNTDKGRQDVKKEKEEPWLLLSLFMVRWLLFRMMFASGVVKLTGHDKSWWSLTALPVHFESQCIPTPLAWYLYQWPDYIQRLSVVATYVIEIALPFLFLAPTRFLRLLSFWAQCFLMLNIMASGNYNFFNLLYIVLCISLLNDDIILRNKTRSSSWPETLFNLGAIITLIYLTVRYCFRVEPDYPYLYPELQFEHQDFMAFVTISSRIVVYVALVYILSFVVEIMRAVTVKEPRMFVMALLQIGSCLLLFCLSLPIFLQGISSAWRPETPFNEHLKTLHTNTDHLNIVNSYGLFRSMTGVGGRPEVILEGSLDGKQWEELPFRFKIGNLTSAPPVVLPHQPRLDWQMWFAALGNYQQNPWLVSLIYRLLENEQSVVKLLDAEHYPFSSAPKSIRAKLYLYHFTTPGKNDDYKAWWWREYRNDYLPELSLGMEQLEVFMEQFKVTEQSQSKDEKSFDGREGQLASILLFLRDLAGQGDQRLLVWSVLFLFILKLLNPFKAYSSARQNNV